MIIVKLMGGMGNQMFQYAMGRNLSLKFNVPVKFDLSFLNNRNMGPNFVYRDYDLNLYNVVEDFDLSNVEKIFILNQPKFNYVSDLQNIVGDMLNKNISVLIDGYWQSPLYFKEFEDQIRSELSFKNKVEDANEYIVNMLNKIKSTNSVLVNVRRTDYLNTNFHGVMGVDYINKAKSIIDEKVDNPNYFVFSDDIDWCKENIDLPNMTIVDHSYKGDRFNYYLQLMSNCKHFIIPNSSFAWWSAWLNRGDDKIVIAPSRWLTDVNIDTSDLTPADWIRI